MARKNRNLASFDELATNLNKSTNVNNNTSEDINVKTSINANNEDDKNNNNDTKDNANVDININVNENDNVGLDYLDKLIEGKTKKSESDTVLTGIYLQKDLAQLLDRLGKKGGRGAKSRVVNEALRSVFKEKGLL